MSAFFGPGDSSRSSGNTWDTSSTTQPHITQFPSTAYKPAVSEGRNKQERPDLMPPLASLPSKSVSAKSQQGSDGSRSITDDNPNTPQSDKINAGTASTSPMPPGSQGPRVAQKGTHTGFRTAAFRPPPSPFPHFHRLHNTTHSGATLPNIQSPLSEFPVAPNSEHTDSVSRTVQLPVRSNGTSQNDETLFGLLIELCKRADNRRGASLDAPQRGGPIYPQPNFVSDNGTHNSGPPLHNLNLQPRQPFVVKAPEHKGQFQRGNASQSPALAAIIADPDKIRDIYGISHEYRGDPNLARNRSADIPDALNVSFWITNLPPNITYPQLLAHIRGIGRIYGVYINSPSGNHTTAAAKVIFFDLAAANLFARLTMLGFQVDGYTAIVRKNRIKTAPQVDLPGRSRVLYIAAPADIIDETLLYNFFKSQFTFQLDGIKTLPTVDGWRNIEFRFGSYRCQAEAAWIAIERHLEPLGLMIQKAWGMDPCGA